ncbi:hypothetical protein ACTU6U_00520 [Microbacterium sp. A196]
MVAHKDSRSASLEIASVDVDTSAIVDLREPAVLDELGIEMSDAIAPWQGFRVGR